MRKLMLLGPLTAITLSLTPNTASAYEGAWCATASVGAGHIQEICHFATFEQCRREAIIWGPTTHCNQNPRFLPHCGGGPGPQAVERKKKVRHY